MSLVIGLCGRTASGKTTAAELIAKTLSAEGTSVGVVSMDDFYLALSDEQHERALRNEHDFDCLEAFDIKALKSVMESAARGEVLRFHRYDHASHKNCKEMTERGPFDVVLFEGLYLYSDTSVAELLKVRLFMDVDADESLIRRVRRDIVKRRRDVEGVLKQYETYVKPAYAKLVEPAKKHAHIIIPGGAHNTRAMDIVYSYIRAKLKKKKELSAFNFFS